MSDLDQRGRWKQTIWSCAARRGILLERYYLIDTRWFALYLHHLMTSDEDRALHDHPWSFITFLLSSGYYEVVEDGWPHMELWRRRFSVLYRPAEWRHRLHLVRPCWTLVLRFRRRRDWGFWLPSGFMNWREYGKRFCD